MTLSEFEQATINKNELRIFKQFLPIAKIEITKPEKIPVRAMEIFEYGSGLSIDYLEYIPLNFSVFYKILYADNNFAFVAKARPKQLYNRIEESTYLVGTDSNLNYQGYSELVLGTNTTDVYYKNKPYEHDSFTNPYQRKHGFSLRRTFTLNALSQMSYGLPLYSSTHFLVIKDQNEKRIKPQKLIWERLEKWGLATKFLEEGEERFVFNI